MKAHTLHEIQQELRAIDAPELRELCIRLAKHKKENKELLSYLLFEKNDEREYIEKVKSSLDDLFSSINRMSAWTTKKGLQKVVRHLNKFIKSSGKKESELEMRLYFCKKVRSQRIDLSSSSVINNIYYRETEKIKTIFTKLHEDLQLDYRGQLEELTIV
ncbi:MAG: hypothetical protein ACJ77K_10115 [Bacteroidia bacterium]